MALEHLGCRDLYDAIGVERDAPASHIAGRADTERQRWMKKAQVTAEKTAWLEIITHAQSHLSSPKARARYDRTLALEAEESFDGLAGFALKGLSRLDPGTHAALVEEAAAVGIPSARAELLIGRICRRLGVNRESVAGANATMAGLPAFDSFPGHAGSGQRLTQVHAAALPSLLGSDRDEPGGTEIQHSAVPALRSVAQVGLPGLQTQPLGRRASLRLWVSPGARANRWRGTSMRPSRRFVLFDLDRALEHLERVRELCTNHAARGTGSTESGKGRRASRGSSWPTRRRGPAAGCSPPARPSKPGAGWSIPNRPSSRPPGPS